MIEKTIDVPPDKSISHRSILLNLIALKGKARIENILLSDDTLATLDFAKAIGFDVELRKKEKVVILKKNRLVKDIGYFDCKNSGTTVRHILSIMAGLGIVGTVDGDSSLRNRPMGRITGFLSEMGAKFVDDKESLPITILPSELKRIQFKTRLASAQQKSSFILASLLASGEEAKFYYMTPSRDHTEIMLGDMGIDLLRSDEGEYGCITIKDSRPQNLKDFKVPGDISSAGFFMVLCLLTKGMHLKIKDVNLNPSRTGLIDVLKSMGANIEIDIKKNTGELCGDVKVQYSELKGVDIDSEDIVPRMIDEFPILSVAMACADSKSRVHGVKELRFKESDRVEKIGQIVRYAGVGFKSGEDWYEILPQNRQDTISYVDTHRDHRIIMTAIIASVIFKRALKLDDISGINVSFPGFLKKLKEMGYEHKCSD